MEVRECPICCDKMKLPKLLPCRHSFCLFCLKNYIKKTANKNRIKCPLCRKISKIPTGGVDEFIDNYFMEVGIKDIPDINGKGNLEDLVQNQNETEIKWKYSLSDDDTSDDSEDDVNAPVSLLMLVGRVRTKFKATLVSAFSTGEENCINSIYPISDSESWAIPGGGPDLVQFNVNGQEIKRLPIGSAFCDMVCREDGRILLTMPERRIIGIVSLDSGEFSTFASTHHCRIGDMSSFPDGRIVVVGPETIDNASERRGKIQFFSKTGKYISGLGKNNDDFTPFAVAVNPKIGTFSVVDSTRKCVYTLLQNGDIVSVYTGGLRALFMLENPFVPLGICYDLDGNLIIVDGGSSILHVLDSFGNFLGLILTNHEERFGEPFCVAMDHGGKLWIGDRNDGIIRVFQVNAYINLFEFGCDEN